MRLDNRTEDLFEDVLRISNASFDGVERPPEGNLRYVFDNSIGLYVEEEYREIEAYALVTRDCGTPYIWSIATSPHARKHGHASSLLRQITFHHDIAHEPIELTVNVENPAQKLYFDHGFRATRVMLKYYGEQAGLRMKRRSQ